MKHLFVLIFSLFLFGGCSKEKYEFPQDFYRFVGVWEHKGTDEHVRIKIKESGVFIIEKSFERGEKFQITQFTPLGAGNNFMFHFKKKVKNGLDYKGIRINTSNDTIVFDYGILTDNEEVFTVQPLARVL
jgi:hypothetical protein